MLGGFCFVLFVFLVRQCFKVLSLFFHVHCLKDYQVSAFDSVQSFQIQFFSSSNNNNKKSMHFGGSFL